MQASAGVWNATMVPKMRQEPRTIGQWLEHFFGSFGV